MQNIKRISTLAITSIVLFSCTHSTSSETKSDDSKKELWAEGVRALTYFKVDSLKEAEQSWNAFSKSMDKNKVVKTLLDAVMSGKAITYNVLFNEDSIMPNAVAKKIIHSIDSVSVEDPTTGKMVLTVIKNEITPEQVTYIAFMEDWHFDPEKFKMEKRVTRACLYITSYAEDGSVRGYKPLFWVKLND